MTKLSIFFSHLDHVIGKDTSKLIEIAKVVEAEGADQVVFSEHVALAQVIEGEGEASKFPFQSDEHYPDPFVAMAAIAGATTRLRVSTGILIAPLRPAIVLAKMAATLDQVSGGRLDLGLGAGWHEPEFRVVGVDPKQGLAVLEEQVQACRALWAGGPSSFHGEHVNFDRLFCVPSPTKGADLPVWLAGPPTAKGAARVARLGQGWLPFGNLTADDIARGGQHLRDAEVKQDLTSGSLGIRAVLPTVQLPSPEAMLDAAFAAAPAMIAAGATHLQLPVWRYVRSMDQIGPVIAGAKARLDAL